MTQRQLPECKINEKHNIKNSDLGKPTILLFEIAMHTLTQKHSQLCHTHRERLQSFCVLIVRLYSNPNHGSVIKCNYAFMLWIVERQASSVNWKWVDSKSEAKKMGTLKK